MKEPFISKALLRLAKKAGVKVNLEPEWGFAGQIELPNGRKAYFRNSNLDLNPLGASEIARDKAYANYFMRRMGYPVAEGRTFFSDKWAEAIGSSRTMEAAWHYAEKLGLPVIVKPNSKSQGVGVSKVYNKRDFCRAARFIFKKDNVMLVEQALSGQDYRVLVLDNEVIAAYERAPLSVRGNGRSSVAVLLRGLQREFIANDRDTVIDQDDFRIKMNLRRQGMTLAAVPARSQNVVLLDNANLSAGGEAKDVTDIIHPGFKELAVRVTRDMGLRYCGVDLMVQGGIDEPPRPKKHWILEINSAAGVNYYAGSGKKQRARVDGLYLKVLEALKRKGR